MFLFKRKTKILFLNKSLKRIIIIYTLEMVYSIKRRNPIKFNLTTMMLVQVIILSGLFSLGILATTEEKGAYIKEFNHKSEIYQEKPDIWNITVYNARYDDVNGSAWFFFKFYIDNKLWLNEYNSTDNRIWSCKKGSTTSRIYWIKGWSVLEPQCRKIRIELYRFYDGGFYLEDTTFSNITIVMVLSMQHIYVYSYFVFYLIACLLLLIAYYISGLTYE